MTTAEALRQSPSQSTAATSVSGLKRKTEDDLANEQRFVKRFHLMNLGKKQHQITAEDIQHVQLQLEKNESRGDLYSLPEAPRLRRSRSNAFSDTMSIDDSRNRIFIHNLEDELAELSSDEEHPIFIPDIERRLNMLPKSLLRSDQPPRPGNELVLYEVPSSLTMPIEMDVTRKAIIESRRRAQEQAILSNAGTGETVSSSVSSQPSNVSHAVYDEDDAMDTS